MPAVKKIITSIYLFVKKKTCMGHGPQWFLKNLIWKKCRLKVINFNVKQPKKLSLLTGPVFDVSIVWQHKGLVFLRWYSKFPNRKGAKFAIGCTDEHSILCSNFKKGDILPTKIVLCLTSKASSIDYIITSSCTFKNSEALMSSQN